MPLTAGEKFLLAQVDPFEPRCFGAKIPDTAVIPTVALYNSQLYTPTLTTATNQNCYAFLPTYNAGIIPATEGAASWTWGAAYAGGVDWNKATDFKATFEAVRPVAFGIRLTSSVAPTTATGFVHIAIATETFNNASTWPFAQTIAAMQDYPFYRRVTLASLTQSPLTVINKYVDETAFRFSGADTQGVNKSATNPGADPAEFHIPWSWGQILIAVEGMPSTQPLSLELIMHSECIPKQTGVVQGNPAAPSNPGILASVAHMSANIDATHTEDQQEGYVNQALNLAAQGASDAFGQYSQGASAAIGRAAYSFGYGATVSAVGALARGIMGVNNDPNRLALIR